MAKKYNPFRPNHPVYPGMFVGRMDEINRIDQILFQTKNANPTNILLIGERGIGKSSLLLHTKSFALGELTLDEKHDFLTVDFSIDEKTALIDLARKIKIGLERELKTSEKLLSAIQGIWGFLQRIETSIIKIKDSAADKTVMEFVDEFIFSLVDTVKTITSKDEKVVDLHCKKDGLVILIDEADKASDELGLGSFLKLFSEKLVSEECNRVLIVLAGLPRVHEVLQKSHGSALRLFEEFVLSPLSPQEVKQIIQRGLKIAFEKNQIETTIENSALDHIVGFSEGYPHFVQQIGYSAFDVDEDNNITDIDVETAMFMPKGALDLIGNRYYKELYYRKIEKNEYRKILQIMATKWSSWITKKEIKEKFKGKISTLNHGLAALIKKNIILTKEGEKGLYRLQWDSFAFWISNFTEMEQKAEVVEAQKNGNSVATPP